MFESVVLVPVSMAVGGAAGGLKHWYTMHRSKGDGGEHEEEIRGVLGVREGQSQDDIWNFLNSVPSNTFHSWATFVGGGAVIGLATAIGGAAFLAETSPQEVVMAWGDQLGQQKTLTI